MLQLVGAILICAAPTSRPVECLEYRVAQKQALKTGGPMVVLVSASWCPPCRRMKRESLPQANRDGLVSRCLVTVVDVDKRPKLARLLLKGRSVPQMLVYWKFRAKWWEWRFIGYRSPEKIRAILNTVWRQVDAEKRKRNDSPAP